MEENWHYFNLNTDSRISLYARARYLRYSKTCVKQPLSKRPKIGFQDQLSLNAVQAKIIAE